MRPTCKRRGSIVSDTPSSSIPVNDNPSSGDPLVRVKRLKFRAGHRGIRELDILIGGFANDHLDAMSVKELDAFELLLTVPDQEMYSILRGETEARPGLDPTLLKRLIDYTQGGRLAK